MGPKYMNVLTALMCPVPVIISAHQNAYINKYIHKYMLLLMNSRD
jgi:hypothetical protein